MYRDAAEEYTEQYPCLQDEIKFLKAYPGLPQSMSGLPQSMSGIENIFPVNLLQVFYPGFDIR
jgi:hypothetical protein